MATPTAATRWVPIVDVDPLFGDLSSRHQVATQLGEACERSGFLVIVNHRVDGDLITEMETVTREFFRRPLERKMRVAARWPDKRSGYRSVGASALARSIDQESPPDLVETFGMQPIGDEDPNQWPDQPADFETVWTAYYDALDGLALRLMRAFAMALELPETWFDDKFGQHTNITTMFANYYPAQTEPPVPGQVRRGAHSDFGSLTILHTDGEPGLEIAEGDGWVAAPYVPQSFLVNIGDLLAHWTNDRWISTMHRVAIPPGDRAASERLSIPFFHQPDAEAVIECIPSCASATDPARYPPVTSLEWRDEKIRKAGYR